MMCFMGLRCFRNSSINYGFYGDFERKNKLRCRWEFLFFGVLISIASLLLNFGILFLNQTNFHKKIILKFVWVSKKVIF